MANIDLVRRAEIGLKRRQQTRSQILAAGEKLLSERPTAVTVDNVVSAAGVAKGTFYYHFQNMDDLVAAVGGKLAESFDEVLAPAMHTIRSPISRLSFAFKKFLDRAIADPTWTRLVVQSSQSPATFGHGIRTHLRADLAQAIAEGRVRLRDEELAADVVNGLWYQIARGTLERPPAANLTDEALAALLRALAVSR